MFLLGRVSLPGRGALSIGVRWGNQRRIIGRAGEVRLDRSLVERAVDEFREPTPRGTADRRSVAEAQDGLGPQRTPISVRSRDRMAGTSTTWESNDDDKPSAVTVSRTRRIACPAWLRPSGPSWNEPTTAIRGSVSKSWAKTRLRPRPTLKSRCTQSSGGSGKGPLLVSGTPSGLPAARPVHSVWNVGSASCVSWASRTK